MSHSCVCMAKPILYLHRDRYCIHITEFRSLMDIITNAVLLLQYILYIYLQVLSDFTRASFTKLYVIHTELKVGLISGCCSGLSDSIGSTAVESFEYSLQLPIILFLSNVQSLYSNSNPNTTCGTSNKTYS